MTRVKKGLPPLKKQFCHRINAAKVALTDQVEFFRSRFAKVDSEWKSDGSRVTFVDYAIKEKLFSVLKESFPLDSFLSEEDEANSFPSEVSDRFAWVLDPVDGTNNYSIGLSFCGISLCLMYDGEPRYGFIYDFSRDELIHGGRGHGVFYGRKKISSNQKILSEQSLIGFHFPLPENILKNLMPVLSKYRVRSLGSSALHIAYVALGRIDACIDFRSKVWDIAAGYAMAEELGLSFHFLRKDVFPLRHFSVKSEPIPFCVGSKEAVGLILKALET